MALSIDIRRIVWAKIAPWEIDRDEWGINWERDDGYQGSDRIGTKAEAQRILDNIAAQHRQTLNARRVRLKRESRRR